MTHRLEITRRAQADRDVCFDFIAARSPAGALRWLEAFEAASGAILHEPNYGIAPESEDHAETIRQKLFKTPHGRTYQLHYVVRADAIYIIHVRGAGQELMSPGEIELPDAADGR